MSLCGRRAHFCSRNFNEKKGLWSHAIHIFNNEFNHDIFQAQTNYTELNMSDWKNNSSSLAHGRFKKVSKVFVMRVIELASIYLTFYDLMWQFLSI